MSIESIKKEFSDGMISKEFFIEKMHEFHSILHLFQRSLTNTDVEKIEIDREGVRFTIKHRALSYDGSGTVYLVDPDDLRITPVETFNFNSYEFEDFRMIANLLRNDQIFFDIGGNVGFHSISLSRQFPKTLFHIFEPIPKTFRQLRHNCERNQSHNVKIHNFGFSDSDAEVDYYYYPQGSGNASLRNLTGRAEIEKIRSRVTTVDSFVEMNKVSVNFIKIDVEGAELFVIRGAFNTIKLHRPIIFCEILRKYSKEFNYNPNEIFHLMRHFRYSAYTAKNGRLAVFELMTESTVETNFFFVPNELDLSEYL